MRTGIITIGNELTSGSVQDTNSAYIARQFHWQGWEVAVMLSIGDSEEMIEKALAFAMSQADAVVVTGGLGPTSDDITTAAIARAFGLNLVTDERILRHIKAIFERFGLPWTENNAKQAMFPEGAEIIDNPVGTAAGFTSGKGESSLPSFPAYRRR